MPDYYKATPKMFYQGIRATGLDPSKAGQPGGATSGSIGVRTPTKHDFNYTWLGPYHQALDYCKDKFSGRSPIILRVRLSDNLEDHMIKIKERGMGGFTTKQLIPPQYISVQTAKGDYFTNIGGNPTPYIITGDDQDITDDWG